MTAGHREALTTIRHGISGRKGVTLLNWGGGHWKINAGPGSPEDAGRGRREASHLAIPPSHVASSSSSSRWSPTCVDAAAPLENPFSPGTDVTLRQPHAIVPVTAKIVDEAQALSDTLLEEVRLLANTETSNDKLFPVGADWTARVGSQAQRAATLAIEAAGGARATLAGAHPPRDRPTTSPSAFASRAVTLATVSRGGSGRHRQAFRRIPPPISVVCDNALVSGYAIDQRPVGRGVGSVPRFRPARPRRRGRRGGCQAAPPGPRRTPQFSGLRRPATATLPMMKTTLGLRAIDEIRIDPPPPEAETQKGISVPVR